MPLNDCDKPIVANQCPSMFHVEPMDCAMFMLAIQWGRLFQEAIIDWLKPITERKLTMALQVDAIDCEMLMVATQWPSVLQELLTE